MKALSRILLLFLSAAISMLSFTAYYEFYFKWRGCFNELGRCFDDVSSVVYIEQSGVTW